MKKILFTIFILPFGFISNAQITFQKTYGGINQDGGNSVQQTTDGGYIIIGTTYGFGAGDGDVYLIKTDSIGDVLWTKTYGGIDNESGFSVEHTVDGGYIIAGITYSFGAGISNAYLIKTDSIGNALWSKTYGDTNHVEISVVHQTTDSGYVIAGTKDGSGAGNTDIYLIKTDISGNTLWTKTFGGSSADWCYDIQQTADEGYILAGVTYSAGDANVYLIKTGPNGNITWKKTFGGTGNDVGTFVQQVTDGGYIITGYSASFGAVYNNVYVIKTDTSGNVQWSKTYGGMYSDIGYSIRQTLDGGYIIAGLTSSFGVSNFAVYLIKIKANGNTLWKKTFGAGTSWGGFIRQTTDGGYIISGTTVDFGAGAEDVYLIKTDSLGNSGCYQGSPGTTVTSPATQVTNPATVVTSPSIIVTNPANIVSSGVIVNTPCTNVAIQEITAENSFFISPNPSSGNFNISFVRIFIIGKVEILNIFGENVYAENIFNESKKEINLKSISSGIYFVKVFDGEKRYCKKLIVEPD